MFIEGSDKLQKQILVFKNPVIIMRIWMYVLDL